MSGTDAGAGPAAMPVVQARLDSVAGLTVSHARAQLGTALLAAGRPGEAADQFAEAIAEEPDTTEQARLMLLQAYARDSSGASDQALSGYLNAVRYDSRLISDTAARLNALLSPQDADSIGPWIISDWAGSVRAALDRLPDSAHERAQLEVLLAHVHALRRDHAAAVAALEEAVAISVQDVATVASDLPGWIAVALEDPAVAPRMHVLLAQLDMMLGRHGDALKHVDAALAAGFTSEDDPYGDAQVRQLRGRILEALGRREQAAQSMLEAAQRYTWQQRWEQAEPLLRDLTKLDPTLQEAWWLWSNTRCVAAMKEATQDQSFADAGELREALRLWETGYQLGPPTAESRWVYNLKSYIHTCLGMTDALSVPEHMWLAALFRERYLLLGVDEQPWIGLVWCYRANGLMATALEVIKEAHEASIDAAAATSITSGLRYEQAACLLYLGRYQDALAALDQIDPAVIADPNEFLPGVVQEVRGIGLMMTGDLPAARSALEQAVAENPGSIEAAAHLVTCCRRQHDTEAEQRYNEWVLAQTAPGQPGAEGRQAERAASLLRAGRYAEALALLAPFSASPWGTAATRAWPVSVTGMCLLALGRPEAADTLRQGAAAMALAWNAAEIAAEISALDVPGTEEFSALFTQRSAELAAQQLDAQAAERELQQTSQTPGLPEPARVTCTAAIARMRFAVGDLAGAAQAYESLLTEGDLFPEAWAQYLGVMTRHTAALLRDGGLDEAEATAERALDRLAGLAPRSASQAGVAALAALASMARLRRGDYPAARRHLAAAGAGFAQAGEAAPYRAVGQRWRGRLATTQAYWEFIDHAERCGAGADQASADALADAVDETRRDLDAYFGLEYQLEESLRQIGEEPIRIVLGQGLIENDTEQKVLKGIGEMRTRIRDGWGVLMPGVRFVDDSNLEQDEFVIMFSGLIKVRQRAETFEPAGAEYGKLGPVLRVLESLVVPNLPLFLGSEEVDALVRGWAAETGQEARLGSVLPDDMAWLRLGALARRLAADGLPLRWTEIFAEIGETGLVPGQLETVIGALSSRLASAGTAAPAEALASSAANAAPQRPGAS